MDGSLSDADLNLSAARPERADEGGGNRFQRAIAAWKGEHDFCADVSTPDLQESNT